MAVNYSVAFSNPVNATIIDTSAASVQDKRNIAQLQHTFGTVTGQVTLGATYPSGGYALDTGLSTVFGVIFEETPGFTVTYDKVNKKIRLWTAVNTEVTAGAITLNSSGFDVIYFRAEGLI